MEWFTSAFIKASLTWLAVGVTTGVAMAINPQWTVYRPAHFHMTLLGFGAMMIFGVAYHVIPRFVGHPLRSRRMANVHWWLANAGLLLMVTGFMLRPWRAVPLTVSTVLLAVGGVVSAIGAYAFVYNLWRTMDSTLAHRAVPGAGNGSVPPAMAARMPAPTPVGLSRRG
jgi:heme/copper-type cytochrome/quinol oxidase subunit 1